MPSFAPRFNWATSSQKWIVNVDGVEVKVDARFQLGHFFAEMDRRYNGIELVEFYRVSIGPLLRRNG